MTKKILYFLCGLLLTSYPSFAQQRTDNAVEEIIIVFKTHFDIGYTDFAEAVVQQYSTSMMDNAFDIIGRSQDRSPEKQFIWTVSSWPMAQMINQSVPDIKSKVEKALGDGRFVVHALPFTVETESSDPEALVRGINISSVISRDYDLPLPTDAKMSDVPSHSWILPTLLTHSGVNFLQIGSNAAPRTPDLPVLFWWKGPDGSKLMTMYWEKNYGTSLLPPPDWPHKTWLAIMQTGNNSGPPTPETIDKYLAEIQEKQPNAKVRIGQMSDFYEAIMQENPTLPVVDGDMPDTWIQGYMSMPREVKDSRRISKDLFALASLNTLYDTWSPKGYDISQLLSEAYTNNLLFNEHTFGMAMPHGRNGIWGYGDDFKIQRAKGVFEDIEKSWKEKADRVFSADKIVTPSLNRQLRELANEVDISGKRFFVYNSLPWERSGVVTIKEPSSSNRGTAVKDVETGEIIPISNEKNILQFIANDVPASGYRNYILVDENPINSANHLGVDESNRTIENSHLKIQLDPEKGSISSIVEKKSGREMVDKSSEFGFGQYLYQRFSKEDADSYVKSYVRNGDNQRLGRPNLTDEPHASTLGSNARIVFSKNEVSVTATMLFSPSPSLPHDYSVTVTLWRNKPNVELIWHINSKPADPWPEAGWISLPFNVERPTFKLGRLGAVVDPAHDFVKGSNLDYGFLNSGMAVIDSTGDGVGIATPDAPGISLDRPGLWKYSGDFIPKKPNVFVNLYNNLWSTNFTEWIEGSWSARIDLWFTEDFNNEKSIITPSEESRSPLRSASVNNKGGDLPPAAAGVRLSRKGTLVTAFEKNPDGEGTVLRLWEHAGISGKLKVTLPKGMDVVRATPVDLRGEVNGDPIEISSGVFNCDVKGYAPASFILQ
ncbi:MAG: hypothetical protein ACTIJ2_12265 [Sphingobacteriaceae bacterium]